jgi:hypothetical protein
VRSLIWQILLNVALLAAHLYCRGVSWPGSGT